MSQHLLSAAGKLFPALRASLYGKGLRPLGRAEPSEPLRSFLKEPSSRGLYKQFLLQGIQKALLRARPLVLKAPWGQHQVFYPLSLRGRQMVLHLEGFYLSLEEFYRAYSQHAWMKKRPRKDWLREAVFLSRAQLTRQLKELASLLSASEAARGKPLRLQKEDFLRHLREVLRRGSGGLLCGISIVHLSHLTRHFGLLAGDRVVEAVEELVRTHLGGKGALYSQGAAELFLLYVPPGGGSLSGLRQALRGLRLRHQGQLLRPALSMAALELPAPSVQDALELLQALLRKATATGQDTLVLGKGKARERLLRQLQRRRQELRWIPRAIHRKEVELFYQDIRALRAQGGERDREALARIRHQSRAMPASAFMDTVYDLRLCVELDCLVLEQLLHYAPGLGHLQGRLFVNVSPLSLRCSRYRALLEQALGSLPALVLELSEQALLQEPALARELHRQLGVRFALDDFGTGYSCLKTLAELASEEVLLGLKIDGPLIRAMDTSRATRDIVLSIGRMAKALGLRSIAEYVENASTARALRLMGIDYAQGFFFHQPQHIEGLLREARA